MLLSYVVCVVALATLSPFDFRPPQALQIDLYVSLHDVVLNLLLLFPAGFLYALGRSQPGRLGARAFGLFAGLSLVLEVGQLWLPARTTSAIDVLTNGTGAALGALLVVRLRPWFAARAYNQLTLRLPLSQLFYLLTMLLVLSGLLARAGGLRLWLTLPLGACGALLGAAIYTHRLAPGRGLGGRWSLVATGALGLWFVIATAPAWLRQPSIGALGTALVCGLGAGAMGLGLPRTRGRRFELPTLRALALPFLLYLAGLWHGYAGSTRLPDRAAGMQHIFDGIQLLAAMTVLGYAVAEACGRRPWSGIVSVALAAVTAALLLLSADVWRAGRALTLGDLLTLLPFVAFASWGAAIYRAERALVRSLSRAEAQAT